MRLTLNKWGNSTGIRIPMKIKNVLDVNAGDEIQVTIKGKQVILEKASKKLNLEELTMEELFKDYEDEPFESEIFEFHPMGNEKW